MVTERDRASALDTADARFAAMIEPGSLLEATPECLVVDPHRRSHRVREPTASSS